MKDIIPYSEVVRVLKTNYTTAPKILHPLGFNKNENIINTLYYTGTGKWTGIGIYSVLCKSDFIKHAEKMVCRLKTAIDTLQNQKY